MTMGAKKQSKKVRQILKAPVRILSKARDFYVKGMSEFSTAHAVSLPRSYSLDHYSSPSPRTCHRSSDDGCGGGLREEASSTRRLGMEGELQVVINNGVGRSYSVSVGKIGRIEEDRPCAFEAHLLLCPRSRSRAVY